MRYRLDPPKIYLFSAPLCAKLLRFNGLIELVGMIGLVALTVLFGAACHRGAAPTQPDSTGSNAATRADARTSLDTPSRCDPQFLQHLSAAETPRLFESPLGRQTRERTMQKMRKNARDRAESWMRLVEYRPASAPRSKAVALLSFPQATTSLARRSYLYDNALALLWFAWTGQYRRARAVSQTLRFLQLEDGSWGYSFHLDNQEDRHARYIRSGAVAWAAHALAYFGTQFGEPAALLSAQRAAQFLDSMRLGGDGPARGLVSAGRGYPSTLLDAPPSPKIEFAVSEHQFDAHIVLARFNPWAARRLAERMLGVLWLHQPGRFAVAASTERVDSRRALDAAGAWGALWLLGTGNAHRAAQSYRYARQAFATDTLLVEHTQSGPLALRIDGFRPYEDDIDGYEVQAAPGHIFVEGSMGMGLAAHRLGDAQTAQNMLQTGIALSCAGAPGIPYSTIKLPGFSTQAAAAPTLWFLFLEREMATGLDAPIFRVLNTPSLTF